MTFFFLYIAVVLFHVLQRLGRVLFVYGTEIQDDAVGQPVLKKHNVDTET